MLLDKKPVEQSENDENEENSEKPHSCALKRIIIAVVLILLQSVVQSVLEVQNNGGCILDIDTLEDIIE